jgi:hypothetical protein
VSAIAACTAVLGAERAAPVESPLACVSVVRSCPRHDSSVSSRDDNRIRRTSGPIELFMAYDCWISRPWISGERGSRLRPRQSVRCELGHGSVRRSTIPRTRDHALPLHTEHRIDRRWASENGDPIHSLLPTRFVLRSWVIDSWSSGASRGSFSSTARLARYSGRCVPAPGSPPRVLAQCARTRRVFLRERAPDLAVAPTKHSSEVPAGTAASGVRASRPQEARPLVGSRAGARRRSRCRRQNCTWAHTPISFHLPESAPPIVPFVVP